MLSILLSSLATTIPNLQIEVNKDSGETYHWSINGTRETYTSNVHDRSLLDNYDYTEACEDLLVAMNNGPTPIPQNLINLGLCTKKLTLILDMDGTLLHCVDKIVSNTSVLQLSYCTCFLRPHLETFLERASKDYELILWSAGK
jgi:hypothetical protein